jgi:hypothetical protein
MLYSAFSTVTRVTLLTWGPVGKLRSAATEGLVPRWHLINVRTATKTSQRKRPDAKICLFIQAEAQICDWWEEGHEYESCDLGLACPASADIRGILNGKYTWVFNKKGYLTPSLSSPGEPLYSCGLYKLFTSCVKLGHKCHLL